jgi:small-conductance mechanosensitive channel
LNTFLSYISGLQYEAFGTASLAILVLLLTYVVSRIVERGKTADAKRFWRLTVRHAATATFFMGLFVIWRTELQTLLLALGAATAGFLVAFRENWMSLAAFWVRVVKRTYGLDDFIEIDGQRGRVTDITWLTTTLAETTSAQEGLSYTGRILHVPNNRMLLSHLAVENFTGEYYPHTIKLHLPEGADILQAEALLLAAAEKNCTAFFTDAERYLLAARNVSPIDLPTVHPRVRIQIAELGRAALLLRVVVPFKERARVEQSILHEFLQQTTENTWPRKHK